METVNTLYSQVAAGLPAEAPKIATLVVAFVVVKFVLGVAAAFHAFLIRPGKNLKKMGDWAIVTGATDGIGEAIAFECAKKGLNVLLLSRTEAKLVATEAAIKAKHGKVEVEHLAVDFGNFDKALQDKVAAAVLGKAVAVLVNNVGMSYPFCQYFHELSAADADAMVELNVNSTSRMTHLVLPGMVERKKGCVVNMSSAAAQNPSPLLSQYAGTKGYVEHFTASMAKEYGPKGVHFQVQSPLFVTTKLAKIRKTSLTVPSPKAFAAASVAHFGYETQVSPYPAHALQLWFMGSLPTFVLDKIVMGMHQGIRKAGFKKLAKAGKAN